MAASEWFARWFDSQYYPLLYAQRDEVEAAAFMALLMQHLPLGAGARVLDLACGSGRHAQQLHRLGFQVWGYDLSATRLTIAQRQAGPGLAFFQHDMREPFPHGDFQAVFNLFTSFGYFETTAENLRVLEHIHAALQPGGYFVLDFFNLPHLIGHIVPVEARRIGHVHFFIQRRLHNELIIKDIKVRDQERCFTFTEQVQAFSPDTLAAMLHQSGFRIRTRLGTYGGAPYEPHHSPRLILIAQRET